MAELQAEAHALKQRQLLHETELRPKKQEYNLRLKKDEIKPETEYAKAVAREGAYTQAEAKYLASSDLGSQPRFRVPPPASDSSGSIKSDLSDQAYQILVQQNRVMEEFVQQQQRNTLPRGPFLEGP